MTEKTFVPCPLCGRDDDVVALPAWTCEGQALPIVLCNECDIQVSGATAKDAVQKWNKLGMFCNPGTELGDLIDLLRKDIEKTQFEVALGLVLMQHELDAAKKRGDTYRARAQKLVRLLRRRRQMSIENVGDTEVVFSKELTTGNRFKSLPKEE